MSRQPTAAEQNAYLEQARNQVQTALVQEVVKSVSEKCFKVGLCLICVSNMIL